MGCKISPNSQTKTQKPRSLGAFADTYQMSNGSPCSKRTHKVSRETPAPNKIATQNATRHGIMIGMRFAKGRTVRRTPGKMNRTEAAYASHLEARKIAGEIEHYDFDAIKLRLAETTFYTPDFMVQMADQTIEFHEVKAYWEDDARVKIKVAADKYPQFVFRGAKKSESGWAIESFGEAK